ncbi:MAG: DUF424 domain-containing protein [Promethearchaeota archaeon]
MKGMEKDGAVFVKTHQGLGGGTVVAACDEELLDREIVDGERRVKVSRAFFGGQLLSVDQAVQVLRRSTNFNIMGKRIVRACVQGKIVHERAVLLIKDVPHAIRFCL